MIYLKSLFAGFMAVLAASVATAVVMLASLIWMARRQSSEEQLFLGWDPISFARTPLAWIIVILAFAVGFLWKYQTSTY